jgi:hypothetical protein
VRPPIEAKAMSRKLMADCEVQCGLTQGVVGDDNLWPLLYAVLCTVRGIWPVNHITLKISAETMQFSTVIHSSCIVRLMRNRSLSVAVESCAYGANDVTVHWIVDTVYTDVRTETCCILKRCGH